MCARPFLARARYGWHGRHSNASNRVRPVPYSSSDPGGSDQPIRGGGSIIWPRYRCHGVSSSIPPSCELSGINCNLNTSHCFGTSPGGGNTGNATSRTTTRVLLPTLGQNGTLVLRSDSGSIGRVKIVPQWRDDALLELLPVSNGHNDVSTHGCETLKIAAFDNDNIATTKSSPSLSSSQQTFGRLQVAAYAGGVATSLGRKGALIEVDVLPPSSLLSSEEAQPKRIAEARNRYYTHDSLLKLVATVPEKSNLTCQLANGDIEVKGKLEGDAHFSTGNGSISVSKLRGHKITLDAAAACPGGSSPHAVGDKEQALPTLGVIHVRKAVEARSVRIRSSSRVRARMLNGSDVSVCVIPKTNPGPPKSLPTQSDNLDYDDGGALIDIGSLYVSHGSVEGKPNNEAHLDVDNSILMDAHESYHPGLVRVKSSHGHVTVHAKTTYRSVPLSSTRQSPAEEHEKHHSPLIDLGGVNGSCDIKLDALHSAFDTESDNNGNYCKSEMATRVHFHSMTPESISTITTCGGAGQSNITMDRKLEADLRLLSVARQSKTCSRLRMLVDAHSLTSDEAEDIQSVLLAIDASIRKNHQDDVGASRSISIDTDAYIGEWGLHALGRKDVDDRRALSPWVVYTQGTMMNLSGEPDSRSAVRSQGGGKINVFGAAAQALSGFQGKQREEDCMSCQLSSLSMPDMFFPPQLPLLVVATDGLIKLETLSWFGSIARRYGLGEENARRVGRQASRTPRLDK